PELLALLPFHNHEGVGGGGVPVDQEQLILFRRLQRADGALLRPVVDRAALLALLRLRRRRVEAGRQVDGTPTQTLSGGGGEAEQKAVDEKGDGAVVGSDCGAAAAATAAAAAAAAAGAAAPDTASSDSSNAVDIDSPEAGIDT
ncbi:unnamed protein product, partial [Ectocarpus sp. 8 AP-2014]